MSFKNSRSAGDKREQNLSEIDADDIVKYKDRFDYYVEIAENYKDAIELFRNILNYNRSEDDLIVFVMRLQNFDHPVYVFITPLNLYIAGFGFDDGVRLEFGKSSDKSLVLGAESTPLGYTEGYGDLGGLLNVSIGYQSFVNAVYEIAKGQGKADGKDLNLWKENIKGCIATIAVMCCEGGRFCPLFDVYVKMMMDYLNDKVEPWMKTFINHWERISDVALNGEISPNDVSGPPPIDAKHVYDEDDAELACEYQDWALHVIAVNHKPNALPYFPAVRYRNFHLVVVGDKATGKTSFVKKCQTGRFPNNEKSTRGVDCHLRDFSTTTKGKIRIYCWEVEDNEKFRTIRDNCYKQCYAAIIMFDLTNKSTYDNVQKWKDHLCRINKDIKIVVCGSKCDVKTREVKFHQVTFPRWSGEKPQYFEISAMSDINVESPLLYLAREFLRDHHHLQFMKPHPDDGFDNG